MELLASESFVTIAYDKDRGWLYANWTGDQTFITVRAGCQLMLELVKNTGVHKILNDNREVTSSWNDAANWVGTKWFPEMAAAGVRYFA